jgi:hypothetical protein
MEFTLNIFGVVVAVSIQIHIYTVVFIKSTLIFVIFVVLDRLWLARS